MNGNANYRNKINARKVDSGIELNSKYKLKSDTIHNVNVKETPHRDSSVWYTYLENYKYCPSKDCAKCKIEDPTLYAYCHSGYTVFDKENNTKR